MSAAIGSVVHFRISRLARKMGATFASVIGAADGLSDSGGTAAFGCEPIMRNFKISTNPGAAPEEEEWL